jgi:hypothetical protein|tara:strand:+ start:912 stop:1130 length:219 start_codon:yes stop_codon:yes gene_type:complete
MITTEAFLELNLRQYNNKIVLYNKIYNKIPLNIIKQKIILPKLLKIIEKRDETFRKLRILLKKKRPELFISG